MNKRTSSVIALAVCLTPFVLGISTVNAVKGLSTAPAAHMDMMDKAAEWQAYVERHTSTSVSARSVMDTIEPLKMSLCTTAGLEERGGLLTGSPGKGAVSGGYAAVCSSTTAISNTLGEAARRSEDRNAEANAALSELLDIPELDDVSIFDRQDAFTEAAAVLKKTFSGAQAENLEETVKAQLAIAKNAIPSIETADTRFGASQRQAVIDLKRQFTNIESVVAEFLESGPSQVELEQPEALLPSGEAILRYWSRLTPQILVAVGVDLAILWLAAFLSVSRANLRRLETSSSSKPTSSSDAAATA